MKAYKRLISIFLVLICMFQQAAAATSRVQSEVEALKAEIQKEPKAERLERIVEKILAKLQIKRNTAQAERSPEQIFLEKQKEIQIRLERKILITELRLIMRQRPELIKECQAERQEEQKLLAEPERLAELQAEHQERRQARRLERRQERLEQKRLDQTKFLDQADQNSLAECLERLERLMEHDEERLQRLLQSHQEILLAIATAVAKYQKKLQAQIEAELQELVVAEIRVNEIVEAQIYGRTQGIANFIEIILGTQGTQARPRIGINITDYTKTGAKIRELICLMAKIEALSAVSY